VIPFCFLANVDGGLDLSQGLRRTPDLRTYVAQRLRQNLSFFLGEWFLDQRQGIPYFERILGQGFDGPLLDRLFRRAVLRQPGVATVDRIVVKFDGPTRTASFPVFDVTLNDGSKISAADLGAPFLVNF